MKHDLTLVSAFITGINQSPDKTIDKYVEYGRRLMSVDIPKVIFIDESLIDKLRPPSFVFRPEYNTIVPYKLSDLYLYQYRKDLSNVRVQSSNPKKDTIEYFMVQCHKTEWVKHAIEMNRYDSVQYMWIDFGIYQFIDKLGHLTGEQKFAKFAESLYQIEYQKSRLIRMPGMWDLCRGDWYRNDSVCWYFAGSLFGGSRDMLINFAKWTKDECLKMISTGWLLWEVNIWYLVYRQHPDAFDRYEANHDVTIFDNYKDDLVFRIPINQCDGLGNKLKAFIGSLSVNTHTKIQASASAPYGNFGTVFPSKYIFDEHKDRHYIDYYTSRLPVLKREEIDQPDLPNEYSHYDFNINGLNYLYSNHHIDFYYDKRLLSDRFKRRILGAIHSLELLPHIRAIVDKFPVNPETLVVTIRTWKAPHEHNVDRPYDSNVYKNRIIEVLKSNPKIDNLIIMIDNDQYLGEYNLFLESLKKKVIHYHRDPNLTDVENALIQCLVASKCKYMICNRISSFSELIWWFSDLNIDVHLI